MLKDRYGNDLSTTSQAARDAYVEGVDSLMSATPGMDAHFQSAAEADDGFALATSRWRAPSSCWAAATRPRHRSPARSSSPPARRRASRARSRSSRRS